MRILGIDYGAKRVGLALGDTESRLATPWKVIPNEGLLALVSRLHDILTSEEIQTVIVGVPSRLRQARQQYAPPREIERFIKSLSGLQIKIYKEDETMTSRLALRQAQEGGRSGSQDELAAAAILQTWLDKTAHQNVLSPR